MTAVYALYGDGASAQRAIDRVRASGVSERDIAVISSVPMNDYEFGQIHQSTWLWRIAAAGAVGGLGAAIWLTSMTETSWPLVTGRMPIVSWWTNLIIIFEMTMLGLILVTVATVAVTAGLSPGRLGLYDPKVADGKILVGVENPPEGTIPDLERALGAEPDVTPTVLRSP